MPRDNQPKHRQMRNLLRKQGKRARHDRILIVCEGSKTEPNYFGEIKSYYRIPTANIQILHSELGTSPLQVVEYAERLFKKGDLQRGIPKKAFDQVFAVFDRDDNTDFYNALDKAQSLNQKIKNDEKKLITFQAIPSIPCFEFWLLLHYEDVTALFPRDEVMRKLKTHYPDYEKNAQDVWNHTKDKWELALNCATRLATTSSPHDNDKPYTAIGELVRTLTTLKN